MPQKKVKNLINNHFTKHYMIPIMFMSEAKRKGRI